MRAGTTYILGIEFEWGHGKQGKGIDLGGEYVERVSCWTGSLIKYLP